VLAYIRSHHPATTRTAAIASGGGPNVPFNETEAIAWPRITGVLGLRWLVVEVVRLRDGSTGLRADAEVVWVTPRPTSERIPPGSRTLRVSVVSGIKSNQPKQRPLTVTSLRKISATVALLNALSAAQPGTSSCPNDPGIRVRLAFYASPRSSPLAVARMDPYGCGGVGLSIHNVTEPALEGGGPVVLRIERVLGVSLNLTPPHRF
jgi:hypothetical protein